MSKFGTTYRCVQGCGRRVDCPGHVCEGCRRRLEGRQRPVRTPDEISRRIEEDADAACPFTEVEGAMPEEPDDPATGLPLAQPHSCEYCAGVQDQHVLIGINSKGHTFIELDRESSSFLMTMFGVSLCEVFGKRDLARRGMDLIQEGLPCPVLRRRWMEVQRAVSSLAKDRVESNKVK